jgi:hypothetical protein
LLVEGMRVTGFLTNTGHGGPNAATTAPAPAPALRTIDVPPQR